MMAGLPLRISTITVWVCSGPPLCRGSSSSSLLRNWRVCRLADIGTIALLPCRLMLVPAATRICAALLSAVSPLSRIGCRRHIDRARRCRDLSRDVHFPTGQLDARLNLLLAYDGSGRVRQFRQNVDLTRGSGSRVFHPGCCRLRCAPCSRWRRRRWSAGCRLAERLSRWPTLRWWRKCAHSD